MFLDNMEKNARLHCLSWVALATGALIAWRAAGASQERRRLLRYGRLRALRSAWFTVGGLRMHVRTSTDGAESAALPIVLVHGWSISSTYFIPLAERLAAQCKVYAPDLPGHGLSDTPAKALDIAGLAKALSDWMDAAGISQAILIGHSMGCQIAVELAVAHPEKVDRLVLIGLAPDPRARNPVRQLGRLLVGGMHERMSLILHLAKDYFRMGMRSLPELRSAINYPIEEKLTSVSMPVMLVRGENDPLCPQSWFDESARLLSAQRTAVIPKWGHAVQYSAPQQLNDAILPFLREAGAGVLRTSSYPLAPSMREYQRRRKVFS